MHFFDQFVWARQSLYAYLLSFLEHRPESFSGGKHSQIRAHYQIEKLLDKKRGKILSILLGERFIFYTVLQNSFSEGKTILSLEKKIT